MTHLPERNLDLLRAFALVSVVVVHTLIFTLPAGTDLRPLTRLGTFAVMLFFVHTSFVLMGSLERQRSGAGWKRRFYVRQAFRIYPLTLVALLIVIAMGDPAAGNPAPGGATLTFPPLDATTIISNLALVQNLTGRRDILGPMWMLPIELQLCLFFPFCFRAAQRGTAAVLATFMAFVAAYFLVAHVQFPGSARLGGITYGPVCMGGVIAYHLLLRCDQRRDQRCGQRPARIPWWTSFVMFVLGYACMFVALPTRHQPFTWAAPLLVAVTLPFIQEAGDGALTRAAHIISKYSYGIFLLHVPLLWVVVVKMRDTDVVARLALFGVGITVLPWLAYHFVEQPAIDLGKRLGAGARGAAAALVPAP